jgi:hypothetical protein
MSADLTPDLAPFYGSPSERKSAPITRATLAEIRAFHVQRLAEIERADLGCGGCLHLGEGMRCKKWKAIPPAEFRQAGCDEWTWDEVPF